MEPKIGLALSSGGARGFAHAGVIKALVDADINISMIAGSSMGALVAGCYAAGMDIHHLVKFGAVFNRNHYLDFGVPLKGFIRGNKVKQLMQLLTHQKNIEELQIPIAIVATDLNSGEKVVFRSGSTAEAIRASISIPGVFVPVKMGDQLLVDGGTIDWLPVDEARYLGADVVIGCDVAQTNGAVKISSVFDVITRSIDIVQEHAKRVNHKHSDVLISPNLASFSSTAFTKIKEMITIGENATKEKIPEIMKMIVKWKEQHIEKNH